MRHYQLYLYCKLFSLGEQFSRFSFDVQGSLLMFVNLRALVLNEHLNDLHLDGNLLKHELYDCVA